MERKPYMNFLMSQKMRKWIARNAEKHGLSESTLVELCLQWYMRTGSTLGREVAHCNPPFDERLAIRVSANIRDWIDAESKGMDISMGEVIRIALDVAMWESPYLIVLENPED